MGVAGHQYYIDECLSVAGYGQETDLPKGEFNTIQIEAETEVDVFAVDTDAGNEDIEEAGQVQTNAWTTEVTEENISDTGNINQNKPKDAELVYEMLKPVNRIKTGSPSASSFRKDIVKLGKLNREVKAILPLLTNFGVLTKEQAYLLAFVWIALRKRTKIKMQ